MKVVMTTEGVILYRSSPDFDEGKGIENACIIHKISGEGLTECEIIDAEFDAALAEGIVKLA